MKQIRYLFFLALILICSHSFAQLTSGYDVKIKEKGQASTSPYFDTYLGIGTWDAKAFTDINLPLAQTKYNSKFFNGMAISIGMDLGWNITKDHEYPLFVEPCLRANFGFDQHVNIFDKTYSVFDIEVDLGANLGYIIAIIPDKWEIEPLLGFGGRVICDLGASVPGSYKNTGKVQEVDFFTTKDKSYSDAYVQAFSNEKKANRTAVFGTVGLKMILFSNWIIGYRYSPNMTYFFHTKADNYDTKIWMSNHQVTLGYRINMF